MSLDSIAAYKTYGVRPSYLRFMVNNLFYLPPTYQDCLHGYYSEVCDTAEFVDNIDEGQIYNEGIPFAIVYHRTDPTKLLRRQEHTKVKLSFRLVDPIFNILPTVLVKEIKTL